MSEKAQNRLDAILAVLVSFGMALALYMAFIEAPRESTMGDIQRIFYFHVPSAIAGMTAFAINFAASLICLIKKKRWWDNLALSAAEIGVLFIGIVLITGSLWAKSEWYVWWSWSSRRLTFSLVLCLLYAAYLLIRNYIEDPDRRAMVSAVFGIIAFLDVPLVWFSIRWWRDLHPQPMLEEGNLSASMRPALWICWIAFQLLLVYLLRRRFFLEAMRDEIEDLDRRAEQANSRPMERLE
jgi:heme exporter protein C